MSTDFRNSVDVMTTETTCLSSIWQTDEETNTTCVFTAGNRTIVRSAKEMAYYDGCIEANLSTIKPMIALPFHPANVYEIDTLNENLQDILHEVEIAADNISQGRARLSLLDKVEHGKLRIQQGIIAGCAGGNYVNVVEAAHALKITPAAIALSLAIYPLPSRC